MSGSPKTVGAIALVVTLVLVAVGAAAWAGTAPVITPTAIAGAKLGLGKVAYRRILGQPVRFQAAGGGALSDPGFQLPPDYKRLVFGARKMDVYFAGSVDRAIQITTWNKAYRTAEGVGPCSTFAQLKAAYGTRLKPDPANGDRAGHAFSFTVGRGLIFQLDGGGFRSPRVNAVSLFDASRRGWNKPGGALYLASFVGDGPDQIPCS
jgi:hypothetical protein